MVNPNRKWKEPPHNVSVVRWFDITAAEDTFAAAFIAALLEGMGFADCGRFANAAASLCVASAGAMSGGWNRAAVEQRYALLKGGAPNRGDADKNYPGIVKYTLQKAVGWFILKAAPVRLL